MMDGNFDRFRKKVWTDIFVKCLLVAFATGLVTVNAVLLPCKLLGVDLLWVFYVLIALGGFIAGGGIAFACLKTNDKKIAVRLDGELKLDESVQTALEFQSDKGDMPSVQRESTEKRLAAIPVKSLSFGNAVAVAICAVICVLGIISVPVTCKYAPLCFASNGRGGADDDPVRNVTDWEWDALDDLIEYVSTSKKADVNAKTGMLSELNGLKNVLLGGVTQNSLSVFVQNTVNGVRNAVSSANDSASDGQKTLNTEEGNYVVNRLYEIFALKKPTEGTDPNDPDNPNNPDDPNDPSGGNMGTGELNISDVPFFDPDKGYVKLGEARDEYYEKLQLALEQGLISREEWEYIMLTYFADLSNTDKQ